MPRSLVLCGLLALGTWAAAADSKSDKVATDVKADKVEWPQWRGPKRDGISPDKGLLKEWPKEGPPLAWKVTGLGKGYSSIVISGGKIFTMGDRAKQGGKDKEAHVIALELDGGKELWATPVGKPWGDGGPRCTPTVDGDRVYAETPHGDLVCLAAGDGAVKWRKNLKDDFGGNMMSGWGYSESPFVDGDRLICTPGGKDATLAALDKKTGATVWKSAVPGGDGAAYASVVVLEVKGVRQYVQLLGRGIVGAAAKDGKFLWRYDKIANGTANIPTAIVRDDLVFCSTGYGTGSALLKIEPKGDGFEAKQQYFIKPQEFQNHHGGMILVGDYVYGGHGHNEGFPICVELKTGAVKWKKERGPGAGSAAVVYADGHLYFRYQDGVVALIEATPDGYKEKGKFKLPQTGGPSWPHPVVIGGKLYLREQDMLYCYDVKQKQQ